MATTRRRRDSGIFPLRTADTYGKLTMPGSAALVTDRQVRKIRHGRTTFFHRAKNGINDPYTFFHVVETLLDIEPNRQFNSGQLAAHLNQENPLLAWDAITVGRVLNDILENLAEANPDEKFQPLTRYRDWSGVFYETQHYAPARAVLFRLLNDLIRLCDALHKAEAAGEAPRRQESPLLSCPSVMADQLDEDAA